MTDADIVTLYWARDEQAIAQTAQKFGAYCRKIAMNLLGSQEDAEECENDTWMAAWNSMPQNRPDKLAPYLGRITRNLALDLRERQNAKKRGGGQTETVLEELEFCLPAGDHTAQEVESAETARSISAFLRSQPEQARNIFIRRYWYCHRRHCQALRYWRKQGARYPAPDAHQTESLLRERRCLPVSSRDLFRAIGQIDDDLIESANNPPVKHTIPLQFRHFVPAAACFCLVLLGAAMVSQDRSAGVSQAAETADLNESAPAYEESNSPDTFSAFSMEGSEPDAAAGSVADAPLSSSLKSAMQDSSPLQALSDILLGSGASGSSSLLAHSADELYFGESLILGSSADVLPASLPVYRNSLLDAADNTDAMKARLRTVLDALGLDTTLADTATFSRDSADTISKTVSNIKESAEQKGWDADSSVLNYLSDAAQLQLNIPESDWPGGLTITVSNDLCTSVVCNSSAEVKTFAALAEERVIAADLQEKYGSLFTSLLGGEYTDVTDGGDSTIYGQPSSLFVKFAADSFHYLLVSVDTDGNLLSLHETDRTVEPLGEYTSVSRAEADKRLANGEFLTDSYTAEAVDPAAEPECLANLRLTYVQGSAAYYLPMWEYTIDEGPAALGDGDDVDQTLHTFSAYYVPAVELDEIDVLKNK